MAEDLSVTTRLDAEPQATLRGEELESAQRSVSNSRAESRAESPAASSVAQDALAPEAAAVVMDGSATQMRSLGHAERNANEAFNLVGAVGDTVEQSLRIAQDLQAMARQATRGDLDEAARASLNRRFQAQAAGLEQLTLQLNGQAEQLDPQQLENLRAQDETQQAQIEPTAAQLAAQSLGTMSAGLELRSLASPQDAQQALATVGSAIDQLSSSQGTLRHTQDSLGEMALRLSELRGARSVPGEPLRDPQHAQQSAAAARKDILAQANIALSTQANQRLEHSASWLL